MYYNFGRYHESLRVKVGDRKYRQGTPAMAAGISFYQWSTAQIAALLDRERGSEPTKHEYPCKTTWPLLADVLFGCIVVRVLAGSGKIFRL